MKALSEISEILKNLDNILNEKIQLLNQILNISENQSMFILQLEDENSLNSYLSSSLKEKQKIIDRIKIIDDTFIKKFESFGGELNKNKDFFKDELKKMQNKIQSITDLDIKIRIQEEKNKPIFKNMGQNKKIKTLKANKDYILKKYSENNKK